MNKNLHPIMLAGTGSDVGKASLQPLCAAYSSKMVTVRLPLRHRIWH